MNIYEHKKIISGENSDVAVDSEIEENYIDDEDDDLEGDELLDDDEEIDVGLDDDELFDELEDEDEDDFFDEEE